ncbi:MULTISPECIES: hypothetical protein [unclassified Sporosarcina]|uniref:hypothetical protein n=1 Tax=unclassified Sporosarcina TaxID=2647733 RepID=UPI000C172A6C|nr:MULTISPECIES: hypothetical protein [unclassified Sporosarcina]PID04510.1 hypothetical protein CSV66_14800 [Sporosarcina sp. P30]PID07856.1 hypothetical protein CSV65_13860 [Sporosarcina sp. P31]PID10833.1 hypothetical protein CSV64_14945 [Sporosarcina sp. P32b]
MTVIKKVSVIGSLVIIIAVGGYGIFEWITKEVINAATLFYVFLGIGFLFQSITWGEVDGKHESKKDELEKHITLVSSKISYYLLILLMIIVLAISERVTAMNDIRNIPLVIVIGLAWITMPITEFVVSKKYR